MFVGEKQRVWWQPVRGCPWVEVLAPFYLSSNWAVLKGSPGGTMLPLQAPGPEFGPSNGKYKVGNMSVIRQLCPSCSPAAKRKSYRQTCHQSPIHPHKAKVVMWLLSLTIIYEKSYSCRLACSTVWIKAMPRS